MKEARSPEAQELREQSERKRKAAEKRAQAVFQAQQAATRARRQQDREGLLFPTSAGERKAPAQGVIEGKGAASQRAGPARPPTPEEIRQRIQDQIAALEALHDELIAHLKAIQEAQTDVWEKRWAGDRVVVGKITKKKDLEELRGELEQAGNEVFQLQLVGSSAEVKETFLRDRINVALGKLKSIEPTSDPQ